MKRVLFVNTIDWADSIHTRFFPLSFGYLVSYCRKNGVEFKYGYSEHLTNDLLNRFRPDVVALTSITANYPLAEQYAKIAKQWKQDVKVLVGGIHISMVPQSLSQAMDIGVIGEGEQTFLELAQNSFEPSSSINGIVYWDGGELKQTEERSLIEPLDSIPHPDRSIFGNKHKDFYMFTSRGCAYRCIFCSSSRFWKKIRLHSAEYVVEEINQLKRNYNVKHIKIYDDTFLLDVNRTKIIADALENSGLTFAVAARANQLNDDTVQTLKRMGVDAVGIGFESNSARILKTLQKGNTPEINQKAVDTLHKYGMAFSGSFICDVPGESKADLAETYRFIHANKITYDMYHLMRFPGTPIYEGSTDWGACKVRMYIGEPIDRKLMGTLRRIKPLVWAYHQVKPKNM